MTALTQDNADFYNVNKMTEKVSDDLQSIDAVFKTLLERLNNVAVTNEDSVVTGKSIGDIPSTYKIPAILRHEKAVVGTFVHQDIVPGFKYYVRLNGTTDFLFNRQPMFLESIGQGYGKRLTFESENILYNNNYFWSDSSALGYAFSIHVLSTGASFQVYENGRSMGTCMVTYVSEDQEIINSRNNVKLMEHVKEVQVALRCLFSLKTDFLSDVTGFITVVKGCRSDRGMIKHIHAFLPPSGKNISTQTSAWRIVLRTFENLFYAYHMNRLGMKTADVFTAGNRVTRHTADTWYNAGYCG